MQETAFGGGAGLAIALEKPYSRGTININSTDPWSDSVVDHCVLSNQADLDILVETVKFPGSFTKTLPFRALVPRAQALTDPAHSSNSDIRAVIKESLVPSFAHPISTCSMMRLE